MFDSELALHWDTSTTGREGVEEKELLTASTAGTGRETDPKSSTFKYCFVNCFVNCFSQKVDHMTQILPCGLLRPRGL